MDDNIKYLKDLYSKDASDKERLEYINNFSDAEQIKISNFLDNFKQQNYNPNIAKLILNLYIAQMNLKDAKQEYAINKKYEEKHSDKRVTVEHGIIKFKK